MCLTNESKSPPIKPQYENGEIVCWVIALNTGKRLRAPCAGTFYKIGKRMSSRDNYDNNSFFLGSRSAGRHGFIKKTDARKIALRACDLDNQPTDSFSIIRCLVRKDDIITFGDTLFFSDNETQFPSLRAKAMFYQKVVE